MMKNKDLADALNMNSGLNSLINKAEATKEAPEVQARKKKTSNDGQLALRLDKELIARFRNWAFYNQMSQKDAMEKILPEYLDGKKTATTISTELLDKGIADIPTEDDPAEDTKETKQKEKTVTFAFRTTQKIADMIRSYAYYENKSVRAVMEELITEKLSGVDLPKRKDEEEN